VGDDALLLALDVCHLDSSVLLFAYYVSCASSNDVRAIDVPLQTKRRNTTGGKEPLRGECDV
ncbi:MAG: hypothetical protein PUD81_06540, partial [Eggerthellales bacterium]|nr:hypothetical protein [Eggerthellales bacterium]